ncbi:MAG: methyltransferase domain-containing protein [Clostridia bacterium]|nr:methyltransferase domain-containing protein [Clostridia bacterium]
MGLPYKLLLATNNWFPRIVHPFNLQNDGEKTYAMWQYEKGYDTIKLYMDRFSRDEMFRDKDVLDMGCGAAGKSLYYVSLGARHVTGVDIVEHYKADAEKMAKELGFSDRFMFVLGSAYEMPFEDRCFDTVIMNDFMEHVDNPEAALREAMRLVRTGGRIYINFPPYYHPTGAHLSDAINIPWVQLFYSDDALIKAYKELIRGVPDEAERLALRFYTDENGVERIGYINKMTLKKFKGILKSLGVTPYYYREVPLRSYFAPLAKIPGIKELFVKMAVCVIEVK